MTPELWQKVSRLLDTLLYLEPGARQAELARLRQAEPDVAAEVESLLRHDETKPPRDLESAVQAACHVIDSGTDATPPPALPGAGRRYRPLRFHARGGLGEVYLAHDDEVGREVALKLIQAPFAEAEECRTRFLREAEITGRLEHPGIVPIYGIGQDAGGQPFYAMRFIRGDSLRDAINAFHAAEQLGRDTDERQRGLRELLARLIAVCNATAYAHSRGIIHRDIKPANVMLGSFGETLLVDWGLARPYQRTAEERASGEETLQPSTLASGSGTLLGNAAGTPAYMSPEQASGQWHQVGPASDIFCLGATLYHLLTGRLPYSGGMVLDQARRCRYTPPREIDRRIPAALAAICLKAMAREPEERYGTAKEMAADLERWLGDEPVRAYREPWRERGRRWLRKHRTLVTSSVAVLVAAVLLLTGTTFVVTEAWRLESDQRRKAQEAERMAAASEAKAREQAALAGKVKVLLVKAFRKPDPYLEGDKVTVAAVLGQALQEIDTLNDQPLVQEEFMTAIADTYHSLKLPAGAVAWQKVVVLLQKRLGPDHPNVYTGLNNLAVAYQDAGMPEKALPLLEKILQFREARVGHDHRDTATSMNNLALCYQEVGKLKLALPLFEEACKVNERKLGPNEPATLGTMSNLAVCYHHSGMLALALPLSAKVFKLSEARLGRDHPDTLTRMSNLAMGYLSAGRHEKALPILEEALELHRAKYGPEHPATLGQMSNVASGYQEAGKPELAIPLLQNAVKIYEARLGAEHPATLRARGNLAQAYGDAGKPELQIPLLTETLKAMEARLGPDHFITLQNKNNLASVYSKTKQWDKALPLYEETLKRMTVKLGPDHPDTLNAMSNLASAYRHAGKMEIALPLLKKLPKLMEAQLGADHPDTLRFQGNLASAYDALGDRESALSIYEEVVRLKKAKLGAGHPSTLGSVRDLARSYQSAGKPALAVRLFEETLERTKDTLGADLGPEHRARLITMDNLAMAYMDVGLFEKAIKLHEETLDKRKVRLGPDHRDTLVSMNNLAFAYRANGQLAKALALFEETLAKTKLGPDHPDTLVDTKNLAIAYQDNGQLARALSLFEELLPRMKNGLGPDHAQTLYTMTRLALAYAADKKPGKAVPVLDKYLAVRRTQWGAQSPTLANHMALFAMDLLKYDLPAAAEPLLRECLAIRVKAQPDAWSTFNTKAQLGGSLLGQQKYADAETLLLEGYEGMKQRAPTIPPHALPRLTEALERLVQLYEATGRKGEAEKWAMILKETDRQNSKLVATIHDVREERKLHGKLDAETKALVYQVRLKAGSVYVIDMISAEQKTLDPYLCLANENNKILAADDDSGGGVNARIVFRASADGTYRIRATSVNNGRGEFTLTLRAQE